MEILDIILLLPLVYGFYSGYSKGIIGQLTGIVAIIGAIFFSFMLSDYVKVYLKSHELVNPEWSNIIGLLFTMVSIYVVIKLVGWIFRKSIKLIGLGFVEKLAGAVLGGVKFLIIIYAFLHLLLKINNFMHIIPMKTLEKSVALSFYNQVFALFDSFYP